LNYPRIIPNRLVTHLKPNSHLESLSTLGSVINFVFKRTHPSAEFSRIHFNNEKMNKTWSIFIHINNDTGLPIFIPTRCAFYFMLEIFLVKQPPASPEIRFQTHYLAH